MIEGSIDICLNCGGTVEIPRDLVDAHKDPQGSGQYHVRWKHDCGVSTETEVTPQTFKALYDYARVKNGSLSDSLRTLSEDEETMAEFGLELHTTSTLADIGWASHE